MAQDILQGRLAVEAYPSDFANIPFPQICVQGKSDSISPNALIATDNNFVTSRVKEGDIVYNVTEGTSATVVEVVDKFTLKLNADIFQLVGGTEDYIVYSASPMDNLQDANNGCVLYVGKSGDLKVVPLGQNTPIIFKNVPVGFFPVQVIAITAKDTNADDIIALW